jgi:predicted ArsR family transcriptional regulator
VAKVNWERLARANMHPLQADIIAHGVETGERFSAKTLADEWEIPLPNIAYHLKVLRKAGVLKTAGTEPRRGAVQRYYQVRVDFGGPA